MLDNRDQTVRNDSDMNLDTDSILVKAIELLDVEMLFDSLEEKFHSPSIFVKESDLICRNRQIVGIEDECPLILFVIEHHSAKHLRILFCCFINSKSNSLVTHYSCGWVGAV